MPWVSDKHLQGFKVDKRGKGTVGIKLKNDSAVSANLRPLQMYPDDRCGRLSSWKDTRLTGTSDDSLTGSVISGS